MAKIRNLLIAIAGVACVAIGSAVAPRSAQAAIITNNFRVDNITTGSLANQSFFGNFSYDDAALKGSGFEALDPSNGFLNLSFNFLGNTYTQKSDSGFSDVPQYPQLNFNNGSLLGLDYVVESLVNPGPIASFAITYNAGSVFRAYDGSPFDPNSKRLAEGTVTYGVQAVPTPALLPGLIAFGASVLRQRKKVCA